MCPKGGRVAAKLDREIGLTFLCGGLGGDDAAAEADLVIFAPIEDDGLAGGEGFLGIGKGEEICFGIEGGGGEGGAVTDADEEIVWGVPCPDENICEVDCGAPEGGVVEIPGDVNDVLRHVFLDDIEGEAGGEVEAVALAEGVEDGAVVGPEDCVGFKFADFAGLGVDKFGEEFADAGFADEADAHGFGFLGDGEVKFCSKFFDCGFGEVADGEESF